MHILKIILYMSALNGCSNSIILYTSSQRLEKSVNPCKMDGEIKAINIVPCGSDTNGI